MSSIHIGPSGYRPGDIGYEFDCGIADCTLRYHSLDHRDPTPGVLEIVPPAGKVAHLQIGAQIKATGHMLSALAIAEAFMAGFEDDETQEGIADKLSMIRAAIAAAEGRGITDAPKSDPAPTDFEQRRDGWLIAFVPISSAARQWSIDASPKGARWEHERWYASPSHAADVRREIEAEGFTVREG